MSDFSSQSLDQGQHPDVIDDNNFEELLIKYNGKMIT